MNNKEILLIVEGEKIELNILGDASYGLLSLIDSNYKIVPFASSIYELYDDYKQGKYDDLVSYLRYEKGLKIDDNVLSKNAFAAIYLIFDFEPQYQKYSDEKIKDLLNTFNNETELGKLYINYPMVEAYYHLLSLPDSGFNTRKISLESLNGKSYKKLVNTTTCLKKNNISQKDLCYIILHNFEKSKFIIGDNNKEINHMRILEEQIKLKNSCNELYVLSTFPLFVIDYNFDKAMEILKEKLKKDFEDISNVETVAI